MVLPLNNYDIDENGNIERIDPIADHPCVGCKYKNVDVDCLKEFGCGKRPKKPSHKDR